MKAKFINKMESVQRVNLYVTLVEKEGPFLKLWGQADKNNAVYVEQFLTGIAPQFDLGVGKAPTEMLPPGTLICAKYKDNKYYRAKILNNVFVREGFLEVSFIDYGNKEIVSCGAVRSLQSVLSSILSIPPLAVGFIFAEAHCVGGGEWNDTIFDSIAKEIKYREVQCTLLAQSTQHYLVRTSVEGTDLGNLLIQRGLMQPISLQAQQAVLLSMSMQKQSTPQAQQPSAGSSGINTYKACTLEPGCQYPVYVSYVNDGPCHFSVQLKQTEDVLVMLMNDINCITLRLLEDIPIPGTVCLARCQEDGNICRAVVTNEVDTQFKVFYVDFGNYEVLPMDCLYQIPFKYILPKVMAIRFSLSGVEKPTVTMDMQIAFKKFVDNRLLHMKVLPSPVRTALPKCELWDPETKTSALDVVIRAAQHSYPEPVVLTRGFSQPVKVSFVYSCNRFYVQLTKNETELATLMDELQEICQSAELMQPASIKINVPCCALFSGDQLWYRSQVVEVVGDSIKVRYIDYGNEEIVPLSQLKTIDGEILTVLRPQAIECCLNGYQKMEAEEVRDGLLEELILEGVFTMKVVDMCDKKALVDLFDSSDYNVASLLLDKLAAAQSQVSPVLVVQAGNKIEHRKSFSRPQDQNFKGDRNHNTGREHKSWEKPNERNEKSWRQDNRDNRNYDKNTNDNNERNSWREQNKGFSPNSRSEKHQKQDDTWSSTETTTDNNSNWDNTRKTEATTDGDWNNTNSTDTNTPQDTWNTQGNDDWGGASTNNEDSRPNRKNSDYKSNRGGYNDRGSGGGFKNREDRGGFSDRGDRGFNNDRGDRGFNNDRGDRGFKSDRGDRGFNSDRGDRGFNSDRGDRGFKSDRGGREDYNNRGDRFGGKPRDGGFKQKDFRKDGSELSSSGSEKSFHKGPRTSSRADRGGRGGRSFDKSGSSFKDYSSGGGDAWNKSTAAEDSWNVSAVAPSIDAAPATATFAPYEVVGTEAKILISWFHNPGLFYCQQVDYQDQFKTMMEEIHDFYKDRKPEQVVTGAPVIGLFPEDNVLYRARVIGVMGAQYKVHYVDFGNVSTISKVWPVDKKFMNLPAQAIACSLNGIAPVGEQWADPDSYSSYFDKDNFVCNFVNKDEEKTYVNIFHNSEDIAQLLVRDGLAVSTAPAVPDIEIPLLVGQQFRAVVKSVNNLSDIILALECGLAVNCTMHNLEAATETFEEDLKGLLEQAVIVFVDNVLEDYRLEITLYDTEGNKHLILNPDEGAFDTVDVPCPTLVLRSVITGYVPFADETSVFIQLTEYAEQITSLLDLLFETYDGKPHENTIIPEEGSIYAVHSEDGNWYRGKVISFDDEQATVCYVDYGNSENVAFAELRELETQFLDSPILSLQVTVPSGADSFVDKDVTASIYYGETGWEGTVELLDLSAATRVLPQSEYTETDVLPPAESTETTDTGFATATMEKPEDETSGEMVAGGEVEQIEAVEKEVAVSATEGEEAVPIKGTPVFMSHIDTPCDFYLQFSENLDDIGILQEELQEKVEEMEVLENPVPGALCAAPYSADQQWYRAEVLDADEDITTVRFVDFGNTDVIDNKTTQVKTLPPKLLSLAIYATRCALKIEPVEEGEWNSIALGVFETLASGENLTAEFSNQDEKCSYVELYIDGVNIQEALVKENLAKPVTKTTKTKQTGFVSHLNSPSEFWIQMESCVDELEWIAEQLSAADTFPEIIDLTPGTLCAALFPDDQMWYRARILSNTVAGVELLFVDYGNSCTSADLKQLPEDLVMTAPLAMKCSLQKNEGIPAWTPEAAAKFAEISADGQTIFTVKKISTGETSIVQLVLDGKDVTTMLLPSTEDGYVKEIETLEKLSIEKEGGEKVEEVALEPMEGQEFDEVAKEKLEELNEQGSTLFQIEFVNERTVRLYIDGQDIRPLLGGFRESQDQLNNDEMEKLNDDVTSVDKEFTQDEEKQLETQTCDDVNEESVIVDSVIPTDCTEISDFETLEENVPETITEVQETVQEGKLEMEQHRKHEASVDQLIPTSEIKNIVLTTNVAQTDVEIAETSVEEHIEAVNSSEPQTTNTEEADVVLENPSLKHDEVLDQITPVEIREELPEANVNPQFTENIVSSEQKLDVDLEQEHVESIDQSKLKMIKSETDIEDHVAKEVASSEEVGVILENPSLEHEEALDHTTLVEIKETLPETNVIIQVTENIISSDSVLQQEHKESIAPSDPKETKSETVTEQEVVSSEEGETLLENPSLEHEEVLDHKAPVKSIEKLPETSVMPHLTESIVSSGEKSDSVLEQEQKESIAPFELKNNKSEDVTEEHMVKQTVSSEEAETILENPDLEHEEALDHKTPMEIKEKLPDTTVITHLTESIVSSGEKSDAVLEQEHEESIAPFELKNNKSEHVTEDHIVEQAVSSEEAEMILENPDLDHEEALDHNTPVNIEEKLTEANVITQLTEDIVSTGEKSDSVLEQEHDASVGLFEFKNTKSETDSEERMVEILDQMSLVEIKDKLLETNVATQYIEDMMSSEVKSDYEKLGHIDIDPSECKKANTEERLLEEPSLKHDPILDQQVEIREDESQKYLTKDSISFETNLGVDRSDTTEIEVKVEIRNEHNSSYVENVEEPVTCIEKNDNLPVNDHDDTGIVETVSSIEVDKKNTSFEESQFDELATAVVKEHDVSKHSNDDTAEELDSTEERAEISAFDLTSASDTSNVDAISSEDNNTKYVSAEELGSESDSKSYQSVVSAEDTEQFHPIDNIEETSTTEEMSENISVQSISEIDEPLTVKDKDVLPIDHTSDETTEEVSVIEQRSSVLTCPSQDEQSAINVETITNVQDEIGKNKITTETCFSQATVDTLSYSSGKEIIAGEPDVTYTSLVEQLVTYNDKIKVETKELISKLDLPTKETVSVEEKDQSLLENLTELKSLEHDSVALKYGLDNNEPTSSNKIADSVDKFSEVDDILNESETISEILDDDIKEHTMTDSLVAIYNLSDDKLDFNYIEPPETTDTKKDQCLKKEIDVQETLLEHAAARDDVTEKTVVSVADDKSTKYMDEADDEIKDVKTSQSVESAGRTNVANQPVTSPSKKPIPVGKAKFSSPSKVQGSSTSLKKDPVKTDIKKSSQTKNLKDSSKTALKKSPVSQPKSETLTTRTSLCLPKDLSSTKRLTSSVKTDRKADVKKTPQVKADNASAKTPTKTSPVRSNSQLNPEKSPVKTDGSVSPLKTDPKSNTKKTSAVKTPTSVPSVKTDLKVSPVKTENLNDPEGNCKIITESPVPSKSVSIVGDVLKDIVDLCSKQPSDGNEQ